LVRSAIPVIRACEAPCWQLPSPTPLPFHPRERASVPTVNGRLLSYGRPVSDCVCSIDLGSTWIKAGVFDLEGRALFKTTAPARPPAAWNGFTTFDADDYIDQAFAIIRDLMGRTVACEQSHRILAVVPTCQRATVMGLDARGRPRTPALCWHDASVGEAVASFVNEFPGDRYRAITGMPPMFVLSLFKILALRTRAPVEAAGTRRFALLHDLFLSRLGADAFCCDPSNAAAMGLYDLRGGRWSDDLLEAAGLTADRLPAVVEAGTAVGRVSAQAARQSGLPVGIPLFVGSGDQACATLASGALGPGRISACLGTAGVFNQPVGEPVIHADDPWYCLPHAVPGLFVREGIVPSVGSAFEWIVRVTGLGDVSALDAEARRSSPGANGLRFMPFISGIGTPDYVASVGGSFQEIRATHTRADLMRAVVEGVACETRRVLDVLDWAQSAEVVISGNVCRSRVFTETLAGLADGRLFAADETDLTLRGAALIAATGLGRFASWGEAAAYSGRQVSPARYPATRDRIGRVFADYGTRVARILHGTQAEPALVEHLGFPPSTRRKVDEMIRKSLKLGGVAFYCYRLDGTVTYMDRAALRIIDLEHRYPDPSAVVGLNMRDLISYLRPEGELRQRILTAGAATKCEYHFRTLTGHDRWTLHDSFLDSDPETGEPVIQAMVQDITEKKLAALEVERSRARLRELARRLVEVREKERAQIAKTIHDDIGQWLVALRMQLRALTRPGVMSDDPATRVSDIDAALGRTIGQVKTLLCRLRPAVLDELGLVAAMRHELQSIGVDTGFDVSLKVEGTVEGTVHRFADAWLENALFRIFQEATTNAVRHSGGSCIEAKLFVTADTIELIIADDGVGLPSDAAARSQAFGLLEIEECALGLNGESLFEPNSPHGTIIRARVPRPQNPGSA
jgi:xylulokinase